MAEDTAFARFCKKNKDYLKLKGVIPLRFAERWLDDAVEERKELMTVFTELITQNFFVPGT
jgi:hypothetical protein